jgi:transglycosylase-like protein with SLT domain
MNTNLAVAFAPQIVAAATRHNLDPRLLAAVAAQETGGPGSDSGRNVVGDGGHGHGVFQIDDRSHAFARTPAAMDPAQNADYAAGILSSNLNRYGGDVHAALSAYNTGSPIATGTRTTWADGAQLGYADSVLRHYAGLGGTGGSTAAAPAAGITALGTGSTEGLPDITALFGLFQQLGSAGAVGMMASPINVPPYQPLPKTNENDVRDLAPDSTGAPADPT